MTKFRPCIDLHQGQVKQIVGITLSEGSSSSQPATNFSTNKPATEYAKLYQQDALVGGHVIMLGPGNTEAAIAALKAYPHQLQVGGGINESNCQEWIQQHGASHVIITSAVFRNGHVDWERLQRIVSLIGKDKLVLDLSCRKKPNNDENGNDDNNNDNPHYYVVTDKWQKFTNFCLTPANLQQLGQYCAEFLVHGVEVEGKQCGILHDLVTLLGQHSPVPVTYAGGVRQLEDLDQVHQLGGGRVDVTVGSALDIFGGALPYRQVVEWHNDKQKNQQGNEKDGDGSSS